MNDNKEKKNLQNENFKFIMHESCEYFPCHEVDNKTDFNCLFCYCPLYTLGEKCNGNFTYTSRGIKDCSKCLIPHKKDAFDYITGHFQELVEMAKR